MPDVEPVQPGEYCSVCSEPMPPEEDTITLLGRGDVHEVCSIQCAEDVLQQWRESATDSPPSGCTGY